jgi:hypothetical protein
MLFANADEALRAALWRRFAVMTDRGPKLCEVPAKPKITFESSQAAWGCARELNKLFPDRTRYAYPCGDHWHTTKRKHKEE